MDPAISILQEYQEINPSGHDTFKGPPTALEFSRMIHTSRPVLFQDCPLPLRAKWTNAYLAERVGDVQVAKTPDGRADALVDHEGTTFFVEPLEECMTMEQLLRRLSQENDPPSGEVVYLQSQNDNLNLASTEHKGPFHRIRDDIPADLNWATEALDRRPDAVNIWIGNHESVTSVHSDPYENVYSVVRGTKIFTLFPPTEGWCLKEKEYPHARWTRDGQGELRLYPTPEMRIRWSSIRDPTQGVPLTRPVVVEVREGEMLYLPAGWWHYVQQEPDQHGAVLAVNYWYDQQMQGNNWVFLNFLRSLGQRES